MSGWMDGWVGRWVDGWMGGRIMVRVTQSKMYGRGDAWVNSCAETTVTCSVVAARSEK